MATVHLTQLSDVVSMLPVIGPFEAANSRTWDLFVCANGFEPRSIEVAKALVASGHSAARSLVFEYSTNISDNHGLKPELLKLLNALGANPEFIDVDGDNPGAAIARAIESQRALTDRPLRVAFDVSASTNRATMTAFRALSSSDVELTVLYAEAGSYHPTREEFEDLMRHLGDPHNGLEWGVGDVVVASDGFPGYHVDQLPDFLVLMAGYNRDRARAIISYVDPSLLQEAGSTPDLGSSQEADVEGRPVAWIVGRPRLDEDEWRIDAQRKIHGISDSALRRTVSTFDYRKTVEELEALYAPRRGDCRMSLSPMGSKMQAIGAAVFCILRPDVRVLFAKPKGYNASAYSKGCKGIWTINFGSMRKFMATLDRLDTLAFVDD